jgi:hypothetical protein
VQPRNGYGHTLIHQDVSVASSIFFLNNGFSALTVERKKGGGSKKMTLT